jgi:hypothetical protein
MSVVLREMDGLERNREEKKTTQHRKKMDGRVPVEIKWIK